MLRQLLQCVVLIVMADIANVHEAVWKRMGASVEDQSGLSQIADDCLFVLPGAAVRGLENARPYFTAYLGAYPDTVKRVHQILRDPRTVVIRSTVAGRNSGELVTPVSTAPPSGLEVEWDIVEWLVVEHDKIVEWRVYQEPTPYIDALRNLDTRLASADEAAVFDESATACLADTTLAQARLFSPLDREPRVVTAPGEDG